MLTGDHVREACELLWWDSSALQRHTALTLVVVERILATQGAISVTMAEEIALKDAFHRANLEFT